MADQLQLLLEAERRGFLPPDKVAVLAEARKRGLVPEANTGLLNPFKHTTAAIDAVVPDHVAEATSEAVGDFGRNVNTKIVDTVGALGDLGAAPVAWGARQLGLDKSLGVEIPEMPISTALRTGASKLGMTPPPGVKPPEGYMGSAGRVTGDTVTAMVPISRIGVAANAAQEAMLPAARHGLSTTQKIMGDIGKTLMDKPGRVAVGETAASTTSGITGEAGAQAYPDSAESARSIGEIIGGFIPSFSNIVRKVTPSGMALDFGKKALDSYTAPDAGHQRASERLDRAFRDKDSALNEFDNGDVLPNANLTSAQRTNDLGMYDLEKEVTSSSQELKGKSDKQIQGVTQAIRDEADALKGDASLDDTRATLESRRKDLLTTMDNRVKAAQERAEKRIADLGPRADREQANLIVREELEKALSVSRATERSKWNAVPQDVEVPTTNAKRVLAEFEANTPAAQKDDIPAKAKKFLGSDAPDDEASQLRRAAEDAAAEAYGRPVERATDGDRFGDTTTVKEMHGLYSELRAQARNMRAGDKPNYNGARIADDIAAAILEDIRAVEQVDERISDALQYSFGLSERFKRGPVGKLLGSDGAGGDAVLPGLTLEKQGGLRGPQGRETYDAMRRAVGEDDPDRLISYQSAVTDHLKNTFASEVVGQDGAINAAKAQRFMRVHAELFDRLPALKTQFEDAIKTGKTAEILQRRQGRVEKGLEKESYAAVFLGKEPGGEFDRVLKSPKSGEVMDELLRQVSKDPSGKAVEGLRAGFIDHLMTRATTKHPEEAGEAFISGTKFLADLDDPKVQQAMEKLFTPAQRARIKTMANTALRAERSIMAKGDDEGVIGDVQGKMTERGLQMAGAMVGRVINKITGLATIQVPGIVSSTFKETGKHMAADPARRVLIKAVIDDPQLFRALMTKGPKPGETPTATQRAALKRINAWLAGVGADAITFEEEE